MIIKWGEVEFEGPYPITDWEPPHQATVYAIMRKPHPQMKVYKFVYFGESSNLSERGFYRAHHKYDCWVREAGSEGNLYIGIHHMPDSTDEQRRKLESDLMLGPYKPACNMKKIEAWVGKLDDRLATWLWCRLRQEKWWPLWSPLRPFHRCRWFGFEVN